MFKIFQLVLLKHIIVRSTSDMSDIACFLSRAFETTGKLDVAGVV